MIAAASLISRGSVYGLRFIETENMVLDLKDMVLGMGKFANNLLCLSQIYNR